MAAKAEPPFPVLSTARLTLRAPTMDDSAGYSALLAFPEVTRFSNLPASKNKAGVARVMRWMAKAFDSGKGCAWLIEDTASHRIAGAIRFNQFERKSRCGEIGYELHPDFWGNGLMTEAVIAVADCGFALFNLNRIEAWTVPGNAGSDRVLERAGFRYEGTLRQKARFGGEFHDLRMFGRLAGDPAP